MTIDFDTLFARLGKFFASGEALNTAGATTIPAKVDASLQELGDTLTAPYEAVRNGVLSGLTSYQGASDTALNPLVAAPARQLIILTVNDDNQQPSNSIADATDELIRQMEANTESLDASTPGASASYDGGNVGDGTIVSSVKRADGRAAMFVLAEDIVFEVTAIGTGGAATMSISGEPSINALSRAWPGGSGTRTTAQSRIASDGANLISNGGFETQDTNAAHLPEDWIASVATLGTTLKLSTVEIQNIVVTGTPSAGFYTISWTNAASQVQTTTPLAYNASGADVQAALRALVGLESITVVTTGTSPNYTHTITFTNVAAPAQLTSTNGTTGGTLTHNTTTASTGSVMRGSRAVEFDSNGSQLTTIQTPVTLAALTQYAACVFAMADVVPAAGVITVDLVDGIGGTVINDDQGTANSYTFTGAGLATSYAARTGVFRTPTTLPAIVYFRARITTAVSAGTSVFLDEAQLVPMSELYTDGVSVAIFSGPDAWAIGDRATLAATNDNAGLLHSWLNRVLSLRENRRLFPTVTDGSETQPDSLL